MWKGVQGEEMKVKDRECEMLAESNAVRKGWVECSNEFLNV